MNLVTPLEEIGYGDGNPPPPIPEPTAKFWFTLLFVGMWALYLVLWLHS